MDGRGRALDNVFVERLWRSVKWEEVYLKDYSGVSDAIRNLSLYFLVDQNPACPKNSEEWQEMESVAHFVEVIYPVLVPVVVVAAIFWFGVNHDRKHLLFFVLSIVLVLGLFRLLGLFWVFFISLPSLFVAFSVVGCVAALLVRVVDVMHRRSKEP